MKIGIVFFSLLKMIQGKSEVKSNPEQFFFISENEEIKQKIEAKLQKKVQLTTLNSSFSKESEIIFDANYLSFKEIISFMEQYKNKAYTFKILPPNSNFIIGSNSSNDRGEVILLED